MSNYGQAALSIVGFVVGSYFGYPQLGFVLGSLAGQALFPTQLPGLQGPRLQDTRTTTASVGAPVMEVFGTDAVPGVVMYTGPVEEVATTEELGGKGGPEQEHTTYAYFQTLVVGLCRGPMGGIKQIFENGKLVYDRSPQRDDESDSDFADRIVASDAYESTFTLYLGDEEQLPDPTLEAELGVGEAPAFRGLMYIVFPERELRNEQGLRHPNFKFVVFDEGSLSCEDVTDYSGDVLFPWVTNSLDPRNCLNDHLYTYGVGDIGGGEQSFDTLDAALDLAESHSGRTLDRDIRNIGFSSQVNGPIAPHIVHTAAFPNSRYKYFHFNDFTVGTWIAGNPPPNGGIGNGYKLTCLTVEGLELGPGALFWWSGRNQDYPNPTSCSASYHEAGLWMVHAEIGSHVYDPPIPAGWSIDANGCSVGVVSHQHDIRIRISRVPREPDHPCAPRCGTPPPAYSVGSGYCISNGRIVSTDGEWVRENTNYHVLQEYALGTSDCSETQFPLNPARPVGHDDDTQEFWEAVYTQAVDLGFMPAGLEYGVDYPATVNHGYRLDYSACTVTNEGVSIADIVRQICMRVGFTEDQIDVSDLEDRFVDGYVITRVMNARDAIEPLRLVGYFDIVESGKTLRFPVRGKPAVRTLTLDDLGIHDEQSDAPPAIATRKLQDVELPRQIRLHYRDPARDYEEGEQLSPTRLMTSAVNDVDIECPIAISGELAAQAAEVNWASAWAGRWIQQFNLDIRHIDLEPADCVIVPVEDRLERVRILSIEGPPFARKVEAVRDDADGYVSTAVAEDPIIPRQRIVIYSTSDLILLDLPALRTEDDDAGVYAVAKPTNPSRTWGGARIYRSDNDGATFELEASIANRALVGTLAEDLPAGDPYTWDDSTTIVVDLPYGAFESHTEEEVIEGANTLAIGRHGFWELVQFANAEQVSATQWQLSHLLRGRRGTEYLMGTAFAGDTVVLVSGIGVIRLALTTAQIGQVQTYRAVTFNTAFATGLDQTFTPAGRALYPYSAVQLSATRGSDILISWVRRDRLGLELDSAGADLPMSEASQEYEIEIYHPDFLTAPVRLLEASTTSVTYTQAQQEEDFGSPPIPDEIFVRVYQISATVGRGPPLEGFI